MALLVNDERLTLRVGAGVLGVTAAAIVFVITIFGRMQSDGVTVRVYFREVTAINEGASVQIAGRIIGALSSISLVRADDTPPGHPLHGTGGIVAVAHLEPAWAKRIPRNADFFVSARSVFAPRYLEIGPASNGAPQARALVEGDEIRGIDPPSLDQVLQRTWNSLNDTKHFLDDIRPASKTLGLAMDRLGLTLVSLEVVPNQWSSVDAEISGAIDEATQLGAMIQAGHLDLAGITRLVDRARALFVRVDGVVADLRLRVAALDAAVRRVRSLIPGDLRQRIELATARMQAAIGTSDELLVGARQLNEDIASGRGTLGAIAADLELLDDVKELTKLLKRHPWQVVAKPVTSGD